MHVISPRLHGPERLPHVYAHNQLCLYLPGTWADHQLIADTIIPWTMEWLFHYEIWAATGSWEGGGLHPTSSGRAQSRTRQLQARRRRTSERREIEQAFLALHPERSSDELLNLGKPLHTPRAEPGAADRPRRGTVHSKSQTSAA
ncbi:hypothetical protein [Euzebya sp.]|uniref:hypothetical protein n=1 Tax=Euzebya sp. TaxID=1971409 RepID=UPI003514E890